MGWIRKGEVSGQWSLVILTHFVDFATNKRASFELGQSCLAAGLNDAMGNDAARAAPAPYLRNI